MVAREGIADQRQLGIQRLNEVDRLLRGAVLGAVVALILYFEFGETAGPERLGRCRSSRTHSGYPLLHAPGGLADVILIEERVDAG